MDHLRWGIIGTGAIAGDFARALRTSSRCQVVTAAGSTTDKSQAFASQYNLPGWSASIQALLADDEVDAVYIATPHTLHEAHSLAAIDAGMAVLCEKPVTVDAASAQRVIDAARARGVFFMEAYMYRCHPVIAEVIDKLRAGVIGAVRHVRSDFGFHVSRQPEQRLFNPALAGGGILDVGGYPASLTRLIAGAVSDKPFDEPSELYATGQVGPTGVDELAVASLKFDSGLTAQLTCAVHHDVGTGTWVFGDQGVLHLPDAWVPNGDRHGLTTGYSVTRYGQPPQHFDLATDRVTYAIEADLVAETLPGTQAAWPAMTWDDTLGNMRLLEAWRQQLGVASTATSAQ